MWVALSFHKNQDMCTTYMGIYHCSFGTNIKGKWHEPSERIEKCPRITSFEFFHLLAYYRMYTNAIPKKSTGIGIHARTAAHSQLSQLPSAQPSC